MLRAVAFSLSVLLAAPALAADELVIPEEGFAVSEDIAQLPEPVRAKRDALLAAAKSGDIASLKLIFDAELAPPIVSFGDPPDAIAYLKEQSADGEGREILAILGELLDAPYAAMDGGDGGIIYIWPYFSAYEDMSQMTGSDEVEALRLVSYQEWQSLKEIGWLWWRVSMNERGELQAFVAGD